MSAGERRKLVIKPFRPHSQLDLASAQKTWEELRHAIQQVHRKNASQLSFEEFYRKGYNLVLHKHGDLLYNGIRSVEQDHLVAVAHQVGNTPDELLLAQLNAAWSDQKGAMIMIRDILMYMDRTYVPQHKKMHVYDLGLVIFRETVLGFANVRQRLQALLLDNIDKERRGQLIDTVLMRHTLQMLEDLGVDSVPVYEQEFETKFLESTRSFYNAESLEYISHNTCSDYLTRAATRLAEEQERARTYLVQSTEPKLKQVAERELIQAHAKTLVDMEQSGCVHLFTNSKVDELKVMYELFSRVPSTLEFMRANMATTIKRAGNALLLDQEKEKDPVAFVQKLLDMRDKYELIVSKSCQQDKKFQKALKDAFEHFMNADARCSRYLVLYVDELLKSGIKGMTETQIDHQFERIIVVFRYLQDKDVFENLYKQHLSKRLLGGRSVSEDAERTMITKLKTECGYLFTSKLEGMFTDITISHEVMDRYRKHLAEDDSSEASASTSGVELEVTMLTTGYWPTNSVPSCVLPSPACIPRDHFAAFYLDSHTGRKITWQTHMGSSEVRGFFGKNRHELIVSTYQMCILFLFNESNTLKLHDFDKLNIPMHELKRHLISLCTPKHRILRKTSKGKGIAENETFTANPEYTSKTKRVKVPLVSAKETGEASASEVPAAVEEDRKHLVEAAVVRIMKARKTLLHNELIAEVTRQLAARFSAAPNFIKKRIETLIERGYLERDNEERRLYKYLA